MRQSFRMNSGVIDLVLGVDAVDIKLTEDEIKYLEEPYQPTTIFGHT